MRGSVLFDLLPVGNRRSPLVVLAATRTAATIPVEMTIPRCDPHVLIEAKKIFFFSLGLRIGNGPVQFLQIPPPVPVQQSLRGMFGFCPK
jgi:hypothetical protein